MIVMKALVYTGTESMEFREEPKPEPGENETRVRVHAAGICGSDMHAWHGHDARRVPPMVLGHELAGIAETGPLAGQRVAINPMVTCLACRDCREGNVNLCQQRDLLGLGRQGGYSEYVVAPTRNLMPLPDTLSFEHAALMEPLAVSVHAVRLAERVMLRPISEANVTILGGGAIGLLAALVLKQKGAREIHIAETSVKRLELLKSMDIGHVYDPRSSSPADASMELVVDAVGSGATRAAASALVRQGGVISHIGLQNNDEGLDIRRITLQEIIVVGNYTYSDEDCETALDLLNRQALGSYPWLEMRPLADGAQAFHDIDQGVAPPKIVLCPPSLD